MKNVTIALDDDIHRLARIRAAEMGTSLSALVKDYLSKLAEQPSVAQGVREIPMSYMAHPVLPPQGHPELTADKPTFTKDGKPRKPGAMRYLASGADQDFDAWPDGLLDAMLDEGNGAADQWWQPFASPPGNASQK